MVVIQNFFHDLKRGGISVLLVSRLQHRNIPPPAASEDHNRHESTQAAVVLKALHPALKLRKSEMAIRNLLHRIPKRLQPALSTNRLCTTTVDPRVSNYEHFETLAVTNPAKGVIQASCPARDRHY